MIRKTDVLIAGSGPAGATVARMLSGSGLKVTVLEAGTRTTSSDAQDFYRGQIRQGGGAALRDLHETRLSVVGGTSNHWGGWCMPLMALSGSDEGLGRGWPADGRVISQNYPEACRILGLGRPEFSPQELAPRTIGALDPVLRTEGLSVITWRYAGDPLNFRDLIDADVSAGEGVELLEQARLLSLARRGSELEAGVSRTGLSETWRARTVVLALGGLESVRFLLSNTGLMDPGPTIGLGWSEHPHFPVATVVTDRLSSSYPEFVGRIADGDATFRLGFLRRSSEEDEPDVSITLDRIDPESSALDPRLRSALNFIGEGSEVYRLFARTSNPRAQEGRLRLSSSSDQDGVGRILLDWPVTWDQLLPATRSSFQNIVRALAFDTRLMAVIEDLPAMEFRGGAHHMGGARMSESIRDGVVDARGRLHADSDVYVASSAVFPESDVANPTLSTVALAVGIARDIRGRFV